MNNTGKKCKLCPSWRYGSRPLRGTSYDALDSSEPPGVPLPRTQRAREQRHGLNQLTPAQGSTERSEPHRATQSRPKCFAVVESINFIIITRGRPPGLPLCLRHFLVLENIN
jgi:hypothetical protein